MVQITFPYNIIEYSRIIRYVVSEFQNHQTHQVQKKVVKNFKEYLYLITFL